MIKSGSRILVTGGAGYIGSVLVRLLLEEGFRVRVLDSLRFGGESLEELRRVEGFELRVGDVCRESEAAPALEEVEGIVHLASIVGDPACAREPEQARAVNVAGSRLLYELAEDRGVSRFVFASTCSNYGRMEDPEQYVSEESPLAPVSLYAETKVETEKFLLGQPRTRACQPVVLRFSTVYGLSPRPRFDLTVNEFTRELALGRELVVFGEQFWRPYCHVSDLARSAVMALTAPPERVAFDVFNVGDTSENYQKVMIVEEIRKQIPEARVRYVQKEEDPRDYRVRFDKIAGILGFGITKTVPQGIAEIRQALADGRFEDPDDPRYKNI